MTQYATTIVVFNTVRIVNFHKKMVGYGGFNMV